MKILDLEKIIFRLNVIVIGIIFLLLTPATQIIASWFPGKTDMLWLFPLFVLGVCTFLWFLMSLTLPSLIKRGILEDRRIKPRTEETSRAKRLWRILLPMVALACQMLLLIFMSMCLIIFMRSQTMENLFTNLP
jgi:hypothetical protein